MEKENKVFILILIIFFVSLLSLSFLFKEKVKSVPEDRFTIIVLPDTQYYSESYPNIFKSQIEWIVENKEELNIEMVVHEGDLVQNPDNIDEWNVANESMTILDKEDVPYSVIRGNHDIGKKSYYDIYFPASRYNDEEWYGGSYDNYKNNYQLLNIKEEDYIFVNLDFCPNNDEIEWADKVLRNYSNHTAVLTTHGYLSKDNPPLRKVHVCNSTEYIWEDLIKNHGNLQIVLCGHVHTERRRTDNNIAGNPVYQLLADYQDRVGGGNGFLRIMEFAPLEDKVYVKTYSPYIYSFERDNDSEFILDMTG